MGRVQRPLPVRNRARGRPVAGLAPGARRPTWISRDRFISDVLPNQADPGLTEDPALLMSETTDEDVEHMTASRRFGVRPARRTVGR